MEVLRKEATEERVHCHSVIIKKIDFKSRMHGEGGGRGRGTGRVVAG